MRPFLYHHPSSPSSFFPCSFFSCLSIPVCLHIFALSFPFRLLVFWGSGYSRERSSSLSWDERTARPGGTLSAAMMSLPAVEDDHSFATWRRPRSKKRTPLPYGPEDWHYLLPELNSRPWQQQPPQGSFDGLPTAPATWRNTLRRKLRLGQKDHVCSEVCEGISRCECGKTW